MAGALESVSNLSGSSHATGSHGTNRSPTLALVSVFTLLPLLASDASRGTFPAHAHGTLAAIPLVLIAVACLVYAVARRPRLLEVAKAGLLAAAFLFWAANQFWSEHPLATLFNDVAVALFVVDLCLVIFDWPAVGPRTPAQPVAVPREDASVSCSPESAGQPEALAE